MVNSLYWASALVYALVLLVILISEEKHKKDFEKEERAFALLLKWVIFFCLQDAFWGFCGGSLVKSDELFFFASTLFHLSTVFTTFFWLNYVISYLSDKIKHRRLLLGIDALVILVQSSLLFANLFKSVIFHIEEGLYITDNLRPLAFFNQYAVYLIISIVAGIHAFRTKGAKSKKYKTVFLFSLAPVLSGVFQLLFPNGPFYSMGYFLGCFIIHIFVISEDRSELLELQHEKNMRLEIEASNIDALTGLKNRKCYENDVKEILLNSVNKNFTYLTIDINELKTVNDTIGHHAGDELIKGAAECLKRCLSAYGTVYRIGGDEFAAFLYADKSKLPFIKSDLLSAAEKWHGELVDELSFSVGIASLSEYDVATIKELSKLADLKMYQAKSEYYSRKGVDRRGQNAAYAAMCASYTKILKIDLTYNTYRIIRMEKSEQTKEMGYAETISEWLYDFGVSGQVHPDDVEEYLKYTEINYLRNYFAKEKQSLNIFYRRKKGDIYRQVKMEMIPSEEYSDELQVLYLYVKDIDR